MPSAAQLLGPDGPLARALPGYEARPGQLEMAEAVERTLREDRVLLCEAGTGTGKTLAYLVPAILSGKKVVVSTATRALQEQIVTRDLPLIERALGLQANAALMKGLGNYLCQRRYHEFLASDVSRSPRYARALDSLRAWVDETESGDVGELAGLGQDDPVFSHVASSSDTRIGAPCRFYDDCFVTRMKREAEGARLLVVNHHLFFADLALRGPHPGHVIPDYDAVVFDEAHQMEDIATDFFGVRVSRGRIERVLRDAERIFSVAGLADPLLSGGEGRRHLDQTRTAAEQFWQRLRGEIAGESRATLERDAWAGPLEKGWHELDSALEGLAAFAESSRGRMATRIEPTKRLDTAAVADALDVVSRRAEQLREQLATIVDGAPGRVNWVEMDERKATLSSSPVDVSGIFRARIFESIPSVVLTSATLATGGAQSSSGPFAYLRSRLGLAGTDIEASEALVGSPFDFEHHATLYTPRDLPAPNHPRFIVEAAARIAELVGITGGGAFVLTTSLRSMRGLHTQLVELLPGRRVLLQGQAPKSVLVGAFRAAEDAVLVATSSFWEGVDVPGRALRLVVLEKIPFLVPSDPIVQARALAVETEGGNPFMDFHVPAAAITLKQGFGRLIRSHADRGVVALLDERVHRRGYGAKLLSALPPARRTDSLDEVRAFWNEVETARR